MEEQATISVEDNMIRCGGAWTLPNLARLERTGRMVRWPNDPNVLCDLGGVTAMDTGGALMLQRCLDGLRSKGQQPSLQGLKPEFTELLRKVDIDRPRFERGTAVRGTGWIERLTWVLRSRQTSVIRGLAFLGESTI